ncbi:MAG: RidA family protein [Clostridiales bacterium]|nr:RidA family protein [Clostridiales bacterium]
MEIIEIRTNEAPAAIGPYSQALRAGGFIYTSGQIPLDINGAVVTGGISEQTRQVLLNLQAVLSAAASGSFDVVKTTVFLRDMNDFSEFNEVYAGFFSAPYPARSTVEVARLPKDVLIEIEAVAVVR